MRSLIGCFSVFIIAGVVFAGPKPSGPDCSNEFLQLAVGTRRLFENRIGQIHGRTSIITENTGITHFDVDRSTYKMVGILGNGSGKDGTAYLVQNSEGHYMKVKKYWDLRGLKKSLSEEAVLAANGFPVLRHIAVNESEHTALFPMGNGLTVKEVMENAQSELSDSARATILTQYEAWLSIYNPKFLKLFPLTRYAGKTPGIQPQNVIFDPETAAFIIIDPT
ncbi:MAG: hypothetical protein U1E10_04240 [Bdellovibrionales bacterium]|nr:hypothetical protein [Bdellovibrionales bacterium]